LGSAWHHRRQAGVALLCRSAQPCPVLGDLSIPATPAQGRAYLPKTIAYARRCGKVSGSCSPAYRAPRLDYLRGLVGDRQLTFWRASYSTFLGQTYANLFPHRLRAMALDGLVDPRTVVKGTAGLGHAAFLGADA
jgi:pimeloyl-ACP methyl ester carboxylesterase